MAVAITYGVGKAADAWLKAGQPKDMDRIKEIFEAARKEGIARFKEFKEDPTRNLPLGDETKDMMKEKAGPLLIKSRMLPIRPRIRLRLRWKISGPARKDRKASLPPQWMRQVM